MASTGCPKEIAKASETDWEEQVPQRAVTVTEAYTLHITNTGTNTGLSEFSKLHLLQPKMDAIPKVACLEIKDVWV